MKNTRFNLYSFLRSIRIAGLCVSLTWIGSDWLRAQTPAFPGAEGFGKYATGARGGSVYFVTTTNDSGAGSFRDAVSVSGRTIIFRVGGVIDYQAPRYAPKPNITIAGQTAPGGGVTIYGNGLSFSGSHNNICRFIRVREGIHGDSGTDAMGIANGHDMIFDHITASWGRDETFSINGNVTNITIQSAIVSQGLQTHSAGGLIQTDGGVSILRSLYIDNDTRNPKVKGVNEFVNNVVCNWETIGYNMGGDSSGESFANVFNNYFLRGQASGSTAIGGGNTDFHIYATNNWYDGNRNGLLDGADLPFASYGSMDLKTTPFAYPISYASAYSPLTALKLAISDAGPSFTRDSVDERMITELTSWGTLGGTITSELLPPMNGPGVIRNGIPYADADNDGMPDFWENGTGSNPGLANNNDASPSGSGYTRLEDFLNWLAEPHGIALMSTNVVVDLRQFTRGWVVVNHNPVWSVSSPVNGGVTLLNDYFAQFVPTVGLNSNASFTFTVNDDDGSPVTRTMNLFFTPSAQSYQPVWHGDDLANNWETLGDYNWSDGISLLYPFHAGEAVTFDDSGSTNPAVNLVGSLQPASVLVDAKKHYTFSGAGSLDGAMSLMKTNAGTLTLDTTNNFTGNTIVSNGAVIVNGALNQSAVLVRSGGAIGGNGALGNGLTIYSGGSLTPGDGNGAPGTLTVTNGLTLSGGTTNRFDLSDDPTGTTKTNDVVNIIGNLNLSGVNTIKISLLDGLPGNGVYTLFTYTGTLNGTLANFSVSGVSGTLTNPPGAIAILVDAQRPPATLTWAGDSVNNIWDTGTNVTWLNDGVPDKFLFLDDVLFDDSGSTAPAVSLRGDVNPNSVTVAADVSYTFGGSGKITGTTGLVKTNAGTLTITTVNDFTGPVIIGGGAIAVSSLANGSVNCPLGAATSDPANLQLFNSTLQYSGGSVTVDRGATLASGGGTFNVANSGSTLTWNGTNVGSGTLIKSGAGTLTLSAENSFDGGTIINEGTLALNGPSGGGTVTANNYALGSGNVTFQGGTLKLFGYAASTSPEYGTFSRPMIVPDDETGTLLTPPRYTMGASLSGGGTLNLEVDYLRGTLSGNWSAFTGRINVTAHQADSEFRVANTAGYAGAFLNLGDDVVITRSGSATTIEIGTLAGTSGSRIGPGSSTSSGSSYRVGWRNEDAVFAGRILADGVNTVTKVGTGNWTLGGASTYSGGTVVSAGTLTVNNTSGSGTGTGAVTVSSGATLAGMGIISGAVSLSSGATLSPGSGGIGTLTVNNSATLVAGSTTLIEINKTSLTKDQLNASGALTYGGSLIVTNLSGTLAEGDSFKIFNGSTYSGSFASMTLPVLSAGIMWNTNTLSSSGTISVVSTNFTGPQSLTWVGDGVQNLWDTGTSINWLTTNSTPRVFYNSDTVTFNDAGSSSPSINLTTALTPASVTVAAGQNYTFAGSGGLGGTMSLTKSGAGTLTLANTGGNTFTGGTTIQGGTLQIGDGASINGSIAGNISNSATLAFANPTTFTNSSAISGVGALRKSGGGALVLTGSKTYTGTTTVTAGSLQLNGAIPSGDFINDGNLIWSPGAAQVCGNSISGSGSLTVNGTGTLTLTGASSFGGSLTNNSGSLLLSNNLAAGAATVVYNGGLIVVGNGITVSNDFFVGGTSAVDLCMMATNTGTATWAGNIYVGGSAQWRPGSDGGTLAFTGTADMGSHILVVPRGSVQFASDSYVNSTVAGFLGRDNSGNKRSLNVTIRDNAFVGMAGCDMGGNKVGASITITLQNSAQLSFGANNVDLHNVNNAAAVSTFRLNGGTLIAGSFTKSKTTYTNFVNFNGGVLKAGASSGSFLPAFNLQTVNVQAGGANIDDGGFAITIAAPLVHDSSLGASPDGGLTKSGAGTLTLSGLNTYTGPTMIKDGTFVLSGSIASSTNLYVGAGATFDGSALGNFLLGSGRMIWGNGSVIGSFAVLGGATLAPGSNAIGRLTFTSSLTLASGSLNQFEISKAPFTNDAVNVTGTLSCSGTLIVTRSDAAPLAPGDSFRLFNAGNVTGTFSSVQLPSPGNGLAWDTSALYTSGTISLVAKSPVITQAAVVGSDLVMAGTNGSAGGSYLVLSSTNVAEPRANWTPVLTNQFDSNGAFAVTNAINPAEPQRFYQLQLP